MKNLFLLMIGLVFGLLSVAQNGYEFETDAFRAINISHAFQIYLTQADEYSVTAEAPKDVVDKIHIDVDNGVLEVRMKNGYKKGGWNSKLADIHVYITFPSIDELALSGAVEVSGKNTLSLDDFALNVSGASEIELSIKCDDLEIDLSGASEVAMMIMADNIDLKTSGASEILFEGETDDLNISCSGASEINAEALDAKDVDIECSGASEIKAWVGNEISVSASGMSDIRYKCNGCHEGSIETTGNSTVKKY